MLDNFERKLEKAKEILPSIFRIGETIITYVAVIGGRLFSNHQKNMNHEHKDSKDLISVIITLRGNISGGGTVFYDGLKTSDLGSGANGFKHLHGGMIFGPFEKEIHKGTLWTGHKP